MGRVNDLAVKPKRSWASVRRRMMARGGVIAESMRDAGVSALLACIDGRIDPMRAVNVLRMLALIQTDRNGDTVSRGQIKEFFNARGISLRTYGDYKEKPREYY